MLVSILTLILAIAGLLAVKNVPLEHALCVTNLLMMVGLTLIFATLAVALVELLQSKNCTR